MFYYYYIMYYISCNLVLYITTHDRLPIVWFAGRVPVISDIISAGHVCKFINTLPTRCWRHTAVSSTEVPS